MKVSKDSHLPIKIVGQEKKSGWISIISYLHDPEKYKNIIETVVTDKKELKVKFDYPLTRNINNPNFDQSYNCYVFTFHNKDGFNMRGLCEEICNTYRMIYDTEKGTSSINADKIPGMLNRNITDGMYGIWGHDIDDLVIEGISITRLADQDYDVIDLSIGS